MSALILGKLRGLIFSGLTKIQSNTIYEFIDFTIGSKVTENDVQLYILEYYLQLQNYSSQYASDWNNFENFQQWKVKYNRGIDSVLLKKKLNKYMTIRQWVRFYRRQYIHFFDDVLEYCSLLDDLKIKEYVSYYVLRIYFNLFVYFYSICFIFIVYPCYLSFRIFSRVWGKKTLLNLYWLSGLGKLIFFVVFIILKHIFTNILEILFLVFTSLVLKINVFYLWSYNKVLQLSYLKFSELNLKRKTSALSTAFFFVMFHRLLILFLIGIYIFIVIDGLLSFIVYGLYLKAMFNHRLYWQRPVMMKIYYNHLIKFFDVYFTFFRSLIGVWFVSGNVDFFQYVSRFDNSMIKDLVFNGWILHKLYLISDKEFFYFGNLWVKSILKLNNLGDYITFKVSVNEFQTTNVLKRRINFRGLYNWKPAFVIPQWYVFDHHVIMWKYINTWKYNYNGNRFDEGDYSRFWFSLPRNNHLWFWHSVINIGHTMKSGLLYRQLSIPSFMIGKNAVSFETFHLIEHWYFQITLGTLAYIFFISFISKQFFYFFKIIFWPWVVYVCYNYFFIYHPKVKYYSRHYPDLVNDYYLWWTFNKDFYDRDIRFDTIWTSLTQNEFFSRWLYYKFDLSFVKYTTGRLDYGVIQEQLVRYLMDWHLLHTISLTLSAGVLLAICDIIEQLGHRISQQSVIENKKNSFWNSISSYTHLFGQPSFVLSSQSLQEEYEEQVDWELLSDFANFEGIEEDLSGKSLKGFLNPSLDMSYPSFAGPHIKFYHENWYPDEEDLDQIEFIMTFEHFNKCLKFAFYSQMDLKVKNYKKLLATSRWYENNGNIFRSGLLPINLNHFKLIVFFIFSIPSKKWLTQFNVTDLRFDLLTRSGDTSNNSIMFNIIYDYYGRFLKEGEDVLHSKLLASGVEWFVPSAELSLEDKVEDEKINNKESIVNIKENIIVEYPTQIDSDAEEDYTDELLIDIDHISKLTTDIKHFSELKALENYSGKRSDLVFMFEGFNNIYTAGDFILHPSDDVDEFDAGDFWNDLVTLGGVAPEAEKGIVNVRMNFEIALIRYMWRAHWAIENSVQTFDVDVIMLEQLVEQIRFWEKKKDSVMEEFVQDMWSEALWRMHLFKDALDYYASFIEQENFITGKTSLIKSLIGMEYSKFPAFLKHWYQTQFKYMYARGAGFDYNVDLIELGIKHLDPSFLVIPRFRSERASRSKRMARHFQTFSEDISALNYGDVLMPYKLFLSNKFFLIYNKPRIYDEVYSFFENVLYNYDIYSVEYDDLAPYDADCEEDDEDQDEEYLDEGYFDEEWEDNNDLTYMPLALVSHWLSRRYSFRKMMEPFEDEEFEVPYKIRRWFRRKNLNLFRVGFNRFLDLREDYYSNRLPFKDEYNLEEDVRNEFSDIGEDLIDEQIWSRSKVIFLEWMARACESDDTQAMLDVLEVTIDERQFMLDSWYLNRTDKNQLSIEGNIDQLDLFWTWNWEPENGMLTSEAVRDSFWEIYEQYKRFYHDWVKSTRKNKWFIIGYEPGLAKRLVGEDNEDQLYFIEDPYDIINYKYSSFEKCEEQQDVLYDHYNERFKLGLRDYILDWVPMSIEIPQEYFLSSDLVRLYWNDNVSAWSEVYISQYLLEGKNSAYPTNFDVLMKNSNFCQQFLLRCFDRKHLKWYDAIMDKDDWSSNALYHLDYVFDDIEGINLLSYEDFFDTCSFNWDQSDSFIRCNYSFNNYQKITLSDINTLDLDYADYIGGVADTMYIDMLLDDEIGDVNELISEDLWDSISNMGSTLEVQWRYFWYYHKAWNESFYWLREYIIDRYKI